MPTAVRLSVSGMSFTHKVVKLFFAVLTLFTTFELFAMERVVLDPAINSQSLTSKICFEITETAAITNLASTIKFINTSKKKGCKFALDDFGSGLSSFAYLKNLPVDFIKIDGEFIKDIAENPINFSMVRSINEIGHVMGKLTIAEFVESSAILKTLQGIGVDYAQGYYIGLPQPIETMITEPIGVLVK